jgi:inhibitor of KinA
MKNNFSISPLGDTAIIINFKEVIDEKVNNEVIQLFKSLKNASLKFVKDIVPAYASITIHYDLFAFYQQKKQVDALSFFTGEIKRIIDQENTTPLVSSHKKIKIPVCYADKYAPDINEMSREKKLSHTEIIRIHISKTYRVYMIGFLPGFAYMGEVEEKIAMPRKDQPRNVVEAGSVGIAGLQTGIYPFDSPGGWQIIGKTPLKLFDKEKDHPVLLQPGDEIEFYSITEDEFKNY